MILARLRRRRLPDSIKLPSPWSRRLLIGAVALVGITGLVCERSGRAPTQGSDASRYHDRTFRVARVIDGDTLDIDAPDGDKPTTRIRLWGVDCPEVSHGRGKSMHFGEEASDFAQKTLEGRNVHIVLSPRRNRGKYGRLLAYVHLERGGRMFNEMLLEEGYAYADLRFPHHYDKQFEAIERRTRRESRGLWAAITPDQMPKWKQRFERRARESKSTKP